MSSDKTLPAIVTKLEDTYTRANEASGGILGVVRRTIERVGETRVSQASASVAYYALFSLFPMALVLIVIMSYFVDQSVAQDLVLSTLAEFLPSAQGIVDLVSSTLEAVFDLRGEIGLISALGLLWSASAAFTTLAYNIDVAWSQARVRPPLLQRLVGITMILVLGGGLVLLLVLSTLLGVLSTLRSPVLDQVGLDSMWLSSALGRILNWLLAFVAIVGIYRWVPSGRVPWSAALIAGTLSSVAWQIANAGFAWYLGSGLARYELVYGSLTTIIVLLLWIYLSVLILLVGAHLSASIAHWQASREQ